MHVRVVDIRNIRQHRHGLNRQIKIWRRAGQPVPEKALRGDSGDGYRFCVHPERATHNGSISCIVVRPGLVAHHCDNRRACNVIGVVEKPPHPRSQPERAKVVSGDELAHHRAGALPVPITAHNHGTKGEARLQRRQFFEFRRILPYVFISIGGEERVIAVVVRPRVHAAVIVIAQIAPASSDRLPAASPAISHSRA